METTGRLTRSSQSPSSLRHPQPDEKEFGFYGLVLLLTRPTRQRLAHTIPLLAVSVRLSSTAPPDIPILHLPRLLHRYIFAIGDGPTDAGPSAHSTVQLRRHISPPRIRAGISSLGLEESGTSVPVANRTDIKISLGFHGLENGLDIRFGPPTDRPYYLFPHRFTNNS